MDRFWRTALARPTELVLLALALLAVAPPMTHAYLVVAHRDPISRKLERLPPKTRDRIARHDLLSVLGPASEYGRRIFSNDLTTSFVTLPYQTEYSLCREDRVTLTYGEVPLHDVAGKVVSWKPRPQGVESEPLFHVGQLPVSLPPDASTVCDAHHLDRNGTWFRAVNAWTAARGANVFHMAEDQLRSGSLAPERCERGGQDACRQWILSLNDFSKVDAISPCPADDDDKAACYVISLQSGEEVTIVARMPGAGALDIAPNSVASVKVDPPRYVILE